MSQHKTTEQICKKKKKHSRHRKRQYKMDTSGGNIYTVQNKPTEKKLDVILDLYYKVMKISFKIIPKTVNIK